jgi:hypothetical protein
MLMRRGIPFILLLMALSACQTPAPVASTAPAPTLTATLVPLASPEPLPTMPPTATTIPAATPVPLSTVDPKRLTAWTFFDLHDPTRPDLIVPDGDSYRLDPNWQVESIHYLYRREGKGDPPAYAAQHIVRRDGEFLRGAETVDTSKVQALLQAVNTLYPAHDLTFAFGGTWNIELVGTDGRRVVLQSSDRSDPDLAPWNVINNGRIYAQFDGRLADPLKELFGPLHDPTSGGEPLLRKPEEPLRYSFNPVFQHRLPVDGLVSLSGSFSYVAEAGKIKGQISADGSFPVAPVTTTVNGLNKVELQVDGSSQACDISPVEQAQPWSKDLRFVCPVNTANPGLVFRYPITIELSTDSGESIVSAGEIGGIWDTPFDEYVPVLPLHIAMAAAANADLRDLLSDHVVFQLDYDASISTTSPLSGVLMGEILLAGQAEIAGRVIPYTIVTPFAIQDGRFTRWSLTRTALNQMLEDIGRSPLTQRIIHSVQDVTLNMTYAEDDAVLAPDLLAASWGPSSGLYRAHRATCLSNDAIDVPQPNHPLRGFNFNGGQGAFDWPLEFLLLDDQVVVDYFRLKDYQGDRKGVWELLTPKQLHTDGARPFRAIILGSTISDRRPELILWLPDEVRPEEQIIYDKIADSLPVSIDKSDSWGWRAEGLTFVINEQGELEVAACQ